MEGILYRQTPVQVYRRRLKGFISWLEKKQKNFTNTASYYPVNADRNPSNGNNDKYIKVADIIINHPKANTPATNNEVADKNLFCALVMSYLLIVP